MFFVSVFKIMGQNTTINAGQYSSSDYYHLCTGSDSVVFSWYPQVDSLDLNNDGVKDFVFLASDGGGGNYCNGSYPNFKMQPLNGSAVVLQQQPNCWGTSSFNLINDFNYSDLISSSLNWNDTSNYYNFEYYTCVQCSPYNSCTCNLSWFPDNTNTYTKYAAIRLKSGTQYAYGWLEIYNTNIYNYFLKSYALTGFATGIQTIESKSAKIYPNPTQNNFVVEVSDNKIQQLQVVDISGKIVLQQTIAGKVNIDASQLENGVYFVQLKNSIGTSTQKIIVQH